MIRQDRKKEPDLSWVGGPGRFTVSDAGMKINLAGEGRCPVYDSVGFVKALFRVLAVKGHRVAFVWEGRCQGRVLCVHLDP